MEHPPTIFPSKGKLKSLPLLPHFEYSPQLLQPPENFWSITQEAKTFPKSEQSALALSFAWLPCGQLGLVLHPSSLPQDTGAKLLPDAFTRTLPCQHWPSSTPLPSRPAPHPPPPR